MAELKGLSPSLELSPVQPCTCRGMPIVGFSPVQSSKKATTKAEKRVGRVRYGNAACGISRFEVQLHGRLALP